MRDALVWLGQADPVAAVQFDNDGAGDIASALLQIRAVAQAKLRTQGAGRYEFGANELASWAASNYARRDALEQPDASIRAAPQRWVTGCGPTKTATPGV